MESDRLAIPALPCRETTPLAAAARPLGLHTRIIRLRHGCCRYVDEGHGPPVLLLHGAPMTSLAFVRLVRALQPHYRVIAPDFPGWGASDPLPARRAGLAGQADFVQELVTGLDLHDLVAFVHDSSASIGLHALARTPERVAGLVVSGTVPLPLTGRAWLVKLLLRHVIASGWMRRLNRRFNLLPWMVASLAPFLRPFAAAERRVLIEQFGTAAKRDRPLHLLGEMARDEGFMRSAAEATRARLSALPTLLIYGQFDPMRWAGGVSRFRKLLPRSEVRIIAWEEHFPMLASADRVAREMHHWMQSQVATTADSATRMLS